MASCSYCGEPLDADATSTWRRVIGWERRAVAESRRGGSDIVLREFVDEYAHDECVQREKRGLSANQSVLI